MQQLTYADRERLLGNLDILVESWKGTDEDLHVLASRWVEATRPTYGYERAMSRDVLQLSRFLQLYATEADIAHISRGALLHVVGNTLDGSHSTNAFGQLRDAFVCRYAVHEIRSRLGEEATFSLPRLTAEERLSAESLFLDLVAEHAIPDPELLRRVDAAIESLGGLADSSLFHRFKRQIGFLSNSLSDESLTSEQRAYARGALAYFVCEQDAIDDRWGLIGLVDDSFVAQLATDLISPNSEPWADVLDAAAAAIPHCNNLLLEDSGCVQLPSEYQIINYAMASTRLRGEKAPHVVIVTPSPGPMPFLIGFSASLALVFEKAHQREPHRFRVGQKVKVDYDSIAEFAGYCESADGRQMFKLRTYYQERGQKRLGRERSYSINEIGRLLPADSSLSARGQLPKTRPHPANPLPGLDYLSTSAHMSMASDSAPRVLVIASAAECRAYADSLALNKLSLRQVLPMGHLSADAETIVRWSARFGVTPPLLAFAPDADAAYEFAANNDIRFDLLVVDGTGRCSRQLASLERLRQLSISSVVVTDEQHSEELIRQDDAVWEWREEDFASLVWPKADAQHQTGIIPRYERRLRQQARTRPEVNLVPLTDADAAMDAYLSFLRLLSQREKDSLFELDRIASESFRLLSLMLRCAFTPTEDGEWTRAVTEHSRNIATLRTESAYLNAGERRAIEAMEARFANFADLIRRSNPKAEILQSTLRDHPDLTLICPDSRLAAELQRHDPDRKVIVTPTADSEYTAGVVVPGWFRRSRMTSLLSPPVADPVVLLLYSCETRWHDGFLRHRQHAQLARSRKHDRRALFPGVSGWASRQPSDTVEHDLAMDSLMGDVEQLEQSIAAQHVYRKHATTDTSEEVLARLVLFEDGSYGLFTDTYRFNVATHLLESPQNDEEEETVYLRSASQLACGDIVVFGRSGRDIIRTLADTLLRKNQRHVASLWKRALREYANRTELPLERLTEQLRQAGCKVQPPTVNNWLKSDEIIGPQAYRRDIVAISAVTDNEELRSRQNDVILAVAEIRSAHLKASGMLARKVRRLASECLIAGLTSDEAAEEGLEMVQVAEVDAISHGVKRSSTNRLLRGETWLV